MNAFGSLLVEGLVVVLPRFVLRRLFPPNKVSKEIRIELKGESPLQVQLDAKPPRIELYFAVTNLSHFDLVLDRFLFDLWFGQPTLTGSVLRRVPIASRAAARDLYCRLPLSSGQVAQIQEFIAKPGAMGGIHLYATAYFESKIGVLEVEERIERNKI